MAIQKFEDIIAWQKAQDFAVEMYAAFETSKDHSVVLQFPFQIILRKSLTEVQMLMLRASCLYP